MSNKKEHNFLKGTTLISTRRSTNEPLTKNESDVSNMEQKIEFNEMKKINQYEEVPSLFN